MLASANGSDAHSIPAQQAGEALQGNAAPQSADFAAVGSAPAAAAPSVSAPSSARISSELLRGNTLLSGDIGKGSFNIGIRQTDNPGALALVALDLCRQYAPGACTVSGFVGSSKRPDFLYSRNTMTSRERVSWNCDKFQRSDPSQCMT
jgi:hypothetical protein